MLPDVLSLAQAPADTAAGGGASSTLFSRPPAPGRDGERKKKKKKRKKRKKGGGGGRCYNWMSLAYYLCFPSPPPPSPTLTHLSVYTPSPGAEKREEVKLKLDTPCYTLAFSRLCPLPPSPSPHTLSRTDTLSGDGKRNVKLQLDAPY